MLREPLRFGLYSAVITVILTLTGIFGTFAGRTVIPGVTLSTVLLVLVLVGTGYAAAARSRQSGAGATIVSGIVGSLVLGLSLAFLVWLQTNISLSFVFPDIGQLLGGTLTIGQTELGPGLLSLLGTSVLFGAIGGLLPVLNNRLRSVLVTSLALTVVIGLLEAQLEAIIALPDAITLALAFSLGYLVARVLGRRSNLLARTLLGLLAGIVVGLVLALLADGGALLPGGLLRFGAATPVVLSQDPASRLPLFLLIFGFTGAVGGMVTGASQGIHNGAGVFVISLLILGILNIESNMTVLATVATFGLLALALTLIPQLSIPVAKQYKRLPRSERGTVNLLAGAALMVVLVVAPVFLGQYITDVLNLVGLYIIMGIGLNIVVGYAGLLDLGYVAFFAIGAYMLGLLTTPSLLTCGGVPAAQITPETFAATCRVLTFWEAWPIAIAAGALFGVMLGIPVLRLRGDYLAIVTLGFGEIIRLIVKFDDFKPLLGAAQGIANIPRPVLDASALNPAWHVELTGSTGIYYLILVGIIITAVIATRLSATRLGRAWRAMRADEDVAQAVGINLVRTKLLAFSFGAAFAAMGGAVASTRLYGAYPDSYTLQVSINVLSLVIIGGLGSIPGVIVGSLMLIGLPEVLRELENYRLLAFGAMLVVAMLLKPNGLVPPVPRRLTEIAQEIRAGRGAHS
jgi:ABC-type branched-subunit amino acid transport system permease subunit